MILSVPQFQTRVLRAGAVSSERVEAPDRAAVAGVLGVLPQHVLEVREIASAERAKPWRRNARFPLQLFSQELAVLLDAGYPLSAVKGVPILARTASLVAHLTEEQQRPIGFVVADEGAGAIDYDGRRPDGFTPGD